MTTRVLWLGLALLPAAARAQTIELPAAPPGAADDSERFASAVEALRRGDGDTLLVPPGRYRLSAGSATAHWTIRGVRGVTILGYGATLEMSGFEAAGIAIIESEDSSVQGFRIDWSPLPWVAGQVAAIDADRRELRLRLDRQLPVDFAARYNGSKERWGTPWTAAGSRVLRGLEVTRVDHIATSGATATVRLAGILPRSTGVQVGETFLIVARNPQAHAIVIRGSERVRVSGVEIIASPSMGIVVAERCADVRIDNNRIGPVPGRFISTNADGIHAIGPRGHTRIEDNAILSTQDDAIVVGRRGVEARYVATPERFTVTRAEPSSLVQVGDRVDVVLPDAGLASYGTLIALSRDAGQTTFRTSCMENGSCPRTPVGIELPVFFYPPGEATATIRGNTILNTRGRGIRINAPHLTVERNVIVRTTGAQIMIGTLNRPRFLPQSPATDVQIRYNSFIDYWRPGEERRDQATIDIRNRPGRGALKSSPASTQISIDHNTFMLVGVIGVYATDAGEITITANRFRSVADGGAVATPIVLEDVYRAAVEGNFFYFEGHTEKQLHAVAAAPVAAELALRASDNRLFVDGDERPMADAVNVTNRVRVETDAGG